MRDYNEKDHTNIREDKACIKVNLLINAELITLEQVEEMKKSWDKSINDFMAEEEPCSTD